MPARDPWRPARAPRRLLFPTRAENGLPFPLPGPERGRPGAPHCSRVLGRDCRRLATSASAPNSRTEELRGRRVATAVWTVPGRDWPKVMAVVGAGVAGALSYWSMDSMAGQSWHQRQGGT
nr:uncharacterized protein LOC108388231 isoform X3 [Manis javanica]